jgi:hypothetical protein
MTFAFAVERANLAFSTEEPGTITPEHLERLSQPGSFLEVASEILQLDIDGEEMSYIGAIGDAAIEGMRASMVKAAADGKRIQWQFSTSYDFEVRLSSYDDAFVVHVAGPSRADAAARLGGQAS